jgi:hypothetical protein
MPEPLRRRDDHTSQRVYPPGDPFPSHEVCAKCNARRDHGEDWKPLACPPGDDAHFSGATLPGPAPSKPSGLVLGRYERIQAEIARLSPEAWAYVAAFVINRGGWPALAKTLLSRANDAYLGGWITKKQLIALQDQAYYLTGPVDRAGNPTSTD